MSPPMMNILLIEDNLRLQQALVRGLEATGQVTVLESFAQGEDIIPYLHRQATLPDVMLMDVALAGDLNGIEATVAVRHDYPRMPVVFYSIQDDDDYYRDFLASGILTHYAYVKKSNYLLPEMLLPLFTQAVIGHKFVDPDIASRVAEVQQQDEYDPMALLEPNERRVARLLAQGMSNEQIAQRMGYQDKRTISRVNGQIYASWGLDKTATDKKIARTRVALIVIHNRFIRWDAAGNAFVINDEGDWDTFAEADQR